MPTHFMHQIRQKDDNITHFNEKIEDPKNQSN